MNFAADMMLESGTCPVNTWDLGPIKLKFGSAKVCFVVPVLRLVALGTMFDSLQPPTGHPKKNTWTSYPMLFKWMYFISPKSHNQHRSHDWRSTGLPKLILTKQK